MPDRSNDYRFVTRWVVEGTCEEVSEVLGNPLDLPRWWPMVYLEVVELRRPNAAGTGRRVRLLTKGQLPYTLRWEFEVVESGFPYGFTIAATGDFEGTGIWTFTQSGPHVDITFDWRIRAEKPLLRWLSFVLKPLFEANHRWAMARGEECLVRELARRRESERR
jgi:polyketide cyclase/dehydrase/lipid transport protein